MGSNRNPAYRVAEQYSTPGFLRGYKHTGGFTFHAKNFAELEKHLKKIFDQYPNLLFMDVMTRGAQKGRSAPRRYYRDMSYKYW